MILLKFKQSEVQSIKNSIEGKIVRFDIQRTLENTMGITIGHVINFTAKFVHDAFYFDVIIQIHTNKLKFRIDCI